jgi:hypothetical protein
MSEDAQKRKFAELAPEELSYMSSVADAMLIVLREAKLPSGGHFFGAFAIAFYSLVTTAVFTEDAAWLGARLRKIAEELLMEVFGPTTDYIVDSMQQAALQAFIERHVQKSALTPEPVINTIDPALKDKKGALN